MKKIALVSAVFVAAFLGWYVTPAQAQATRTWVSGVGDDVNPCSRTAPCKTFAGAISKTAAFGEINCLDPGGFGAVTITKSMMIRCNYTEGGVLVAGTNAIIVNLPSATDVVYLEGLDILGANTGINGITFIQNGTLHVKGSVIREFNAAGTSCGIKFAPTGAGELHVTDTYIADNGGTTGAGILIQPTGGGSAKAVLERVDVRNNREGIVVNGNGSSGGIKASLAKVNSSGNTNSGLVATSPGGASSGIAVVIRDSTFSFNSNGVQADGAGVAVLIGDSTVSGNSNDVLRTSSGTMNSYKNNQIDDNTTPGTPLPQQPLN